ncbi:MAG: response regulator transcription factor [Dorea sp.]|jgi:DNA-binding response OmpR family regulator|nr:response regulator transcription factor [Dorea sp.]
MVKILLVEDDETICFGVRSALRKKGYEVVECSCVAEGKELLSVEEFHLILLDLNLPDGNGYDFCGWIKQNQDIPVIFLTVRDDVGDITRGLDMGADDYITKPFHIAVLESRIQAVLRRVGFHRREDHDELICGEIRLDKQRMQVYAGDENIILTGLEYRLLLMLMENKGCILSRNRILEKIWDIEGNFVNDNTLTVAIKRLREKIGQAAGITTVRRIGYRMEERK